jgi:O-antigen ligase
VPAGTMRSRVLDPVVLVASLGFIALLAVVLRLTGVPLHQSQISTALAALLLVAASTLLSVANGLVLLFLVPPLFNGEDLRPYFWLLEAFVYLVLAIGFGACWRRRQPLRFPGAPCFLLFLASTVLSFPLDLKELWLEAHVLPWREVLEGVRRSDLAANLFYVRTVLNVLSGIGLYVLVVNQRWTHEAALRLATAATALFVVVTLTGLWLYQFEVAPHATFLTVWLGGRITGGFSGLGFNISYYGQYALAYLPLAGLVLVEPAPAWAQGIASVALLTSPFLVIITNQRAAYLVYVVELALLVWMTGARQKYGVSRARVVLLAAVGGVTLALVLFPGLRSRLVERIASLWWEGDFYRQEVLRVAWQMILQQPVLGIGSGRFAHDFPRYSVMPLSTHDLYVQLLAEQGAVGLGSFLALLVVTLGPVLVGQHRLGEERPAVLALLVSLGGWLVFGIPQYTFLLRSMQVYFWIALGLVVALGAGRAALPRPSLRSMGAAVVILIAGAGLRLHEATARPVPRGLTIGLYGSDGDETRWTGGGALMVVPVEGRVLRLPLGFPIPPIPGRPQTAAVSLDGINIRTITFGSPNATWTTVEIPVSKPLGSTVRVEIRTAFTFIPAVRGMSSDSRRLGVLTKAVTWTR